MGRSRGARRMQGFPALRSARLATRLYRYDFVSGSLYPGQALAEAQALAERQRTQLAAGEVREAAARTEAQVGAQAACVWHGRVPAFVCHSAALCACPAAHPRTLHTLPPKAAPDPPALPHNLTSSQAPAPAAPMRALPHNILHLFPPPTSRCAPRLVTRSSPLVARLWSWRRLCGTGTRRWGRCAMG
jgi:hypothetical protein